ncbi:hypothetical protein NIES2100_04550 [Calothrix sp. NIES-2100]|uniref:hypothetical protein n=1 Tax=Calothrix sp. NIES-2100 TaxID=1954172 RepID=UPI000B60B608|nr:hypothetical protein NIES2100_04550 [Calothrix sp. NIES-2100]
MIFPKVVMSSVVVLGIMAMSNNAKASITNANHHSPQIYLSKLIVQSDTTVNPLAAEIANLEIERVLLLSRYTLNSPQVVATNNKIQDTRNRYMQARGNNALLNQTIANALVNKIASLEVETALLYARYPQHSPQIITAESDVTGLRDRLSKLNLRNHKSTLNSAVSQAIKNKISQLQQEIIQLKARYQINSVEVITAQEKVRFLQKRLSTLI